MRKSGPAMLWAGGLLAWLATALVSGTPAWAAQLLDNPDFETWPGGWSGPGQLDTESPHSGSASVRLDLAGAEASIVQTVEMGPGPATFRVYARADEGARIRATLDYFDSSFGVTGGDIGEFRDLGQSFAAHQWHFQAPAGTALARLTIAVEPQAPGSVWLDAASLDGPLPQPPTATPTATSPPTIVPATATAPATATTPSQSGSPTSTPATATAGPLATATSAPTGATSTPTGSGQSPPPGSPGHSPPLPPSGSPGEPPPSPAPETGGLLQNGGFERVSGGLPVAWQKYGGDLSSNPNARTGNAAASLLSRSASTKWVHQVVPVTGGEWYEFSAWVKRESGSGEIFLRLSFYTSVGGSGSTFEQADSTTTTSSASWTRLTTGPVQAPGNARSVRARLMVRPNGGISAAFDDAVLVQVAEPAEPATPPPTAAPASTPRPTSTPRPAATPRAPGATVAPGEEEGSNGSPRGVAGPRGVRGVTSSGGLVINEILYDGVGQPDHAYEWVELYNTGDSPVSLAGWSIGDLRGSSALPAMTVEAGSYVVIAGSGFPGIDGVPVARLSRAQIGRGLNNDGDTVFLIDPGGTTVDEVTYGDTAETTVASPGDTVGRRADGTWSTTLHATPGQANVFPEPEPGDETETPPVATATPGAGATSTPTPEPDSVAGPPPPEDSGDGSPVPWILLGATVGLSAAAMGSIAVRRAFSLLERRRGR